MAKLNETKLLGKVLVVGVAVLWLIPNPSDVNEVNWKSGEVYGVRPKTIELTTNLYWELIGIVPVKVTVNTLFESVQTLVKVTVVLSIEHTPTELLKLNSFLPVNNYNYILSFVDNSTGVLK